MVEPSEQERAGLPETSANYMADLETRLSRWEKSVSLAARHQPFTVKQAQNLDVCRYCGKLPFTPPDSLILNHGKEFAHQSCLDKREASAVAKLQGEVDVLKRALAACAEAARDYVPGTAWTRNEIKRIADAAGEKL